jgi:phosphodiesterase/alkaline phosphatase D-like protein
LENTNEQARGVVYYSSSRLSEYENLNSVTIGGATAQTDSNLRTSQDVTLSGLSSNTTYYYDVYVTDASGNVSMTIQNSFTTGN